MNYLENYNNDVIKIASSLNFEQKLESARVSLSNKLTQPPPVLQIDNMSEHLVTICTEGNISVIKTGLCL